MVSTPQNGTMSAQGKFAERSEKAVESLSIRERLATPAPDERTERKPAKPASRSLPDLSKEMESLVQKLNVAARDIIEAADGSLPRDLEKKFSGGERDVYTRRLMEGRGKRLERTIGEGYRGDRLMRSRADSYIRLFERLLDTMNAAPQGEKLVEACLASDSGRIYVMLAEIAGRIPPQN